LDAICFHYLSGECANNDECAHLHPAELSPAVIHLLATTPDSPLPHTAELGQCVGAMCCYTTNERSYQYEGVGWITLPTPRTFSYNLPPPASRNADGQSSTTCAYNLPNCWAPHCADPNRLVKALLGSAFKKENGFTEADLSNVSHGREDGSDKPECQCGRGHDR
jgi:hypothetical protein